MKGAMRAALRNTLGNETGVQESIHGSRPLRGQRGGLTKSKLKKFKACLLIQLQGVIEVRSKIEIEKDTESGTFLKESRKREGELLYYYRQNSYK